MLQPQTAVKLSLPGGRAGWGGEERRVRLPPCVLQSDGDVASALPYSRKALPVERRRGTADENAPTMVEYLLVAPA